MTREKATDRLQVKVRMPRRLADDLSAAAEKSGVSLSTEIVNRLQASFAVSDIRNLSRIAGRRPEALEYLSYISAAASGTLFEADKKGDKRTPNMVVSLGSEEAKKKFEADKKGDKRHPNEVVIFRSEEAKKK
jgi:hypothetical protein